MWKSGKLKSGIPWHKATHVEGCRLISPGYNWEAKVFETGSEFGINKGRVSKLHVWQDVEGVPVDVFCYDREPGLDILPAGILDKILEQIQDD